MLEGFQQGTWLLRVDVKSIGKIRGNRISPFLAKSAKPLNQASPVLGIEPLEAIGKIQNGE